MNDISMAAIRLAGMRILLACIVALSLAIIGADLLSEQADSRGVAATLSVALCIYPALLVLRKRIDAQARMAMSITAVALPSLLLFTCRGLAWQVDLHMTFFAALAMTTILCDWKALVAATATAAVHHIVVGMLVPDWIFLGGAPFDRIAVHAVILLSEAGALVWVAIKIVTLIDAVASRETEQQRLREAGEQERVVRMAELESSVGSLRTSLLALSKGDLTAAITTDFVPAYAELKTNFNMALASLRALIAAVGHRATTIISGTRDIAAASDDLARRSESNATSLEATATSLAQVDRRIQATAAAAAATVCRANDAITTVGDGRAVADDAVLAMGRVSDSAKGIDSVIEGLDKIAFQTRVLAMNAAVEAGRAGDAGRGFAVVADLVSTLAMRAEEEAKRARDQLTVTQADVITAVEAVQKVDRALADISGDVAKVHELLATMASDNQAQSAAITEIAATIGAMDRSTRQNAAMVEQTSAATRNLVAEVAGLSDHANQFVVDNFPHAPIPASSSPRADSAHRAFDAIAA